MRVAVVDIGTNSTRLLVAEVGDGHVEELDRRTTVTRLGEGLEATGRLSDAAMERVSDALAELPRGDRRATAPSAWSRSRRAPCATPTTAPRSATRSSAASASTRARSRATRRRGSRSSARPPGGTAGAAHARHRHRRRQHRVRDRPRRRGSRLPRVDPHGLRAPHRAPPAPRPADAGRARPRSPRTRARSSRPTCRRTCASASSAGIAVAGTATSLAAIDQELDPYDPEQVHGYRLSLARCERARRRLAGLTVAERRERGGPAPRPRARRSSPAPRSCSSRCGRSASTPIEVSETDILHGAALAAK